MDASALPRVPAHLPLWGWGWLPAGLSSGSEEISGARGHSSSPPDSALGLL